MARRKVITSNTGKNRAVSVALHSAQDEVQHNSKKINRLHTENTQIPVSSQEKAHFEFRFNNNDHKYLHKKFKKMAFAVTQQVDDIAQPISQSTSINFIKVPSPKRADPQSEIAISINNHIKYSNILIDRELENNVQIKFKNANDNTSDNYGLNSVSDCNEAITRDNKISEKTDSTEIDTHSNKETMNGMSNGRYVCPYCKLSCAKPSVLQKHIRAHTNERPYPCTPCGFAFKTKSNLYKHCRSRAHALRLQGTDSVPSANEDEWSLGSESDVSLSATSLSENSLRVDNLSGNENSSPDIVYQNERVSPTTTHSSGTSQTEFKPKSIYKPKFHKASMYRDNGIVKQELSPSAVFLNQHIAKIISDNEAVVDTLDSPLQKKFSKISTIQRQIGESPNKTILVETKELQPLNLTKENAESETNMRKRCFSDSFAHQEAPKASQHPLNPEGSIIKDLLLKARAQATGLLPVTSEDYDGTETLYVCPLCQISYRSADNLEIHRLYYCKGNSVNNRIANLRPENIYLRSNSIHVTLPETYNPNTLAKLATSTLKSPSARVAKPDDLIIKHDSNDIISTPLPSPGPLLGNTRLVDSKYSSENRFQVYENDHNQVTNIAQDVLFPESKVSADIPHRSDVYTPPSKKKCLENDDLPHGNLFTPPSKKRALESDDLQHRSDLCTPPSKKRGLENNPTTLRSLEELSLSPMRQSSSSLQMFGGEVKIVDNSGTTTTLRIEPTRSQLSPSHVPQSLASPRHQSQSETSSIVVRSGIHSGGTLVHNPPTPKEIMPSPLPQTPRLKVSIAPNISTPNLSVAGIPPPNMSHFQFPPIGSITAYNPLTLPPLSPIPSPNGPSTILHGGKMIPYVPGMPGPNTPTTYLPTHHSVGLKFPTLERITDSPGKEDKQTFSSVGLAQLAERTLKTQNDKKESNIRLQHLRANLNSPDINTKQNNTAKWVNNNCDNTKINSSQSISSTGLKNHNMSNIVIHSNDIVQINFGIMTSVTDNIKREDLLKNSTEILQPDMQRDISRREVKIVTTYASSESVNINSQDPQKEMHHLNFENLISKSEIINNSMADHHEIDQSITFIDLTSTPSNQERSKTSYFKKNIASTAVGVPDQKTKFLRPSSLPLKPGTFIPKKHHGITPNANTTSLISPETPRPAKAFGQLYLNGHAYTYLGLKCSTKVYYCTLNRPQPTYVPNQHSLSMYSNWQVCLEATPHPLGLNPCKAMSIYDSRHRPQNISTARLKQEQIITHSSKWRTNQETKKVYSQDESDERKTDSCGNKNKELAGGFESNEEYIYVRGRGRGRYVCSECGIRCKKPSMLKKHIRTHTDVRPYTCKHCAFSFKTKGNLTKHMKSKSHYQKCRDLGINPFEEIEASEASQGSLETDEGSDSDEDDGNEGETESSDTDSWKSRLPEHEAAQSLLSLWDGGNTTTITPGLLTSARPTTYPYAPQQADEIAITDASVVPTDFPTKPYKEEMSRMERDEPMDLSKVEPKLPMVTEIVMATQEHTVIASLAQNASRFPQNQNQWPGGEPMLHAYLTEKALRDSKIKQSQYTYNKLRSIEDQIDSINIKMEKADLVSSGSHERVHSNAVSNQAEWLNSTGTQNNIQDINVIESTADQTSDKCNMLTLANAAVLSLQSSTPQVYTWTQVSTGYTDSRSNENAKFVASEYLKMTSGKTNEPQDRQFHPHADSIVEHTEENGGNIRSMRENLDKNEDDKQIFSDHLGTARKVVVGAWGMSFKVGSASNEFPSASNFATGRLTEDGRSVCVACNKSFSKPSQLRLHINIHYMERPFRCSACAVSFRTRGHLQKHERSGSHHNKVSMTSTFGAATTANPRPFKCSDCKIAFRIHGHLAKHLRSKMHVMRLECLGKLPFGTFAEIERAGVSLTDIDTTDCDNSLASLQILAQKLHEKDPTKLESWDPVTMVPPLLPAGRESSDEEDISGPDNKSDSNENRSAYKRTESTDFVKAQYSATNT